MKVIGQKLKICAKKARAANKRRVALLHGGFILFTFLDNFWYQVNRLIGEKKFCARAWRLLH